MTFLSKMFTGVKAMNTHKHYQTVAEAVKDLTRKEKKVYDAVPPYGTAPMRTGQIAVLANVNQPSTSSIMTKLRKIGLIKSIRLDREFAHQKTTKLEPREPLVKVKGRSRVGPRSKIALSEKNGSMEARLSEMAKVLNSDFLREVSVELQERRAVIHVMQNQIKKAADALR